MIISDWPEIIIQSNPKYNSDWWESNEVAVDKEKEHMYCEIILKFRVTILPVMALTDLIYWLISLML